MPIQQPNVIFRDFLVTQIVIEFIDQAPSATAEAIVAQLRRYNDLSMPNDRQQCVLYCQDEQQQLIAGLVARLQWQALQIEYLWVAEPYRRQGLGKRLIGKVEQLAIAQGCQFAYVDTFSFQAPTFYQALGYQQFACLEGFHGGQKRFYLRRSLA